MRKFFPRYNLLIAENAVNQHTLNTVSNSSGADELNKYKDLLDSGVISQADFDNAKKKILG